MEEMISIALGRLCKATPWLAPLFHRLTPTPRHDPSPGTDGVHFFYNPEWLRKAFQDGGMAVSAALAHATAHCLLGHVFEAAGDVLAADMAATLLIDSLIPEICPVRRDGLFQEARRRLTGVPLGDAAQKTAQDDFFTLHRDALTALLHEDDHTPWRPESPANRILAGGGAGAAWRCAAQTILKNGDGGHRGSEAGDLRRKIPLSDPPSRDYGACLRRYTRMQENLREDHDSFQYAWYAYGLEHYDGMPLIEPGETREERRLDELAIVIDTSGSCV